MTDSTQTNKTQPSENPHVVALEEACDAVEVSVFRNQYRVVVPCWKVVRRTVPSQNPWLRFTSRCQLCRLPRVPRREAPIWPCVPISLYV